MMDMTEFVSEVLQFTGKPRRELYFLESASHYRVIDHDGTIDISYNLNARQWEVSTPYGMRLGITLANIDNPIQDSFEKMAVCLGLRPQF